MGYDDFNCGGRAGQSLDAWLPLRCSTSTRAAGNFNTEKPGHITLKDEANARMQRTESAGARPMPGKLNAFQAAMLQWNDLHPYNAVHVVRVPAALDLERLRQIIDSTLEELGLTGLTLDSQAGRYEYLGGPARCKVTVLPGGDDPTGAVSREIERQLNTGFTLARPFNPFRCFVVPAGEYFHLGIAYFHAMAGAESLVLLLQDVVNAYLARATPVLARPLDLYPRTCGAWLRRHPRVMMRKLASIPSLYRTTRQSARPHYRDTQNLRNGFTAFSLTASELQRLVATGKAWEVTLNDLFLALLMRCLFPLAPSAAHGGRRNRISVGSIVNIRRDLNVDSRRTFGLFLGSFVVSYESSIGNDMMSLSRDVHRQTQRIKRAQLYMGTPLELACARCLMQLLSSERRRKFHPKYYPLWGGVTNMNLNTLWPQPAGEPGIDYLRAVSTGPVTPLVLSITTVGEIVNVGLSYRTTVFSATDIDRIKSDFVQSVRELGGNA